MKTIAKLIAFFALLSLLAACGGGGNGASFTDGTGGGDGGATGPTAAGLSLATSQASVKSDNSNSATITATVLDASNAALSGVTVTFSTSGGQLSAASATTNTSGQATVLFSSGTADPTNRTATVTATVSGVAPVQIPVIVNGSTLAITSDKPSLILGSSTPGADQATLTITAKNAANAAVFNAEIALSVAPAISNPGAATLVADSTTTSVSGQVTATLTATSPGTVTVTARGLNYTVTQDFVITQQGAAFVISDPASPYALQIGQTKTVTVSAPTQSQVTFTTTLGTWDGGTSALVTKAVVAGTVSADLTSAAGGTANVEVIDTANPSTFASLTVLISAPSSQAAQIDLQSNVTVVPLSVGGTLSQATFTATVRTSGGTIVAGAPVAFSLSNTTGGGETISPVYGITDSTGKVTTTFTAGSLSSDSTGVTVTATVYNSATSALIASVSKNIKINQTAGSVVIGAGTTVGEPVPGGASYTLPMSVVVADSNGNPVQTTVTLSVWPLYYNTGYWSGTTTCEPVITAAWDNEDINRNLILDPTENVPYAASPYTAATNQGFSITDTLTVDGHGSKIFNVSPRLDAGAGASQDFVTDGILTPGNSAGGTLPATVTTDANGLANFTLTYAKQYSVWIKDEIKASTTVLGTETTSILPLPLPYLKADGDGCHLFSSPFNPKTPAP